MKEMLMVCQNIEELELAPEKDVEVKWLEACSQLMYKKKLTMTIHPNKHPWEQICQ